MSAKLEFWLPQKILRGTEKPCIHSDLDPRNSEQESKGSVRKEWSLNWLRASNSSGEAVNKQD